MKKKGPKKDHKPDIYGAYDALQILEEIIYRVLARMEIYSCVGVVSDIDETQRICTVTPIDGSAAIYGVRLQASLSPQGGPVNNGRVNIPKDQSNVIATFLNKDTGFVSGFTEIAKVIDVIEDTGSYDATVKNMGLYFDSNGVVLNGGNNGGVPLSQNTATRFNNIENDINKIKQLFTLLTSTPILTAAPGSQDLLQLKMIAVLASWYGAPLVTTQPSDIENEKVKQ